MTTFYVATRLERIEEARRLITALKQWGWTPTYDWTTHGPVYDRGPDGVRHVAHTELIGVTSADVVIVLLPGGRGTHVELGAALATSYAGAPRVIVVGTAADFECGSEMCAFYLHPNVVRYLHDKKDDDIFVNLFINWLGPYLYPENPNREWQHD